MKSINLVVQEIRQKIADGTELGIHDLEAIREAAKASGRMEHRILYVQVKDLHQKSEAKKPAEENSAPIDEQRMDKLDNQLKNLGEKAKRSGLDKDRVAYVNAKKKLELEREIYAAFKGEHKGE